MKRIPKLIKFPSELVQRIEDYRQNKKIRTFSGAVYTLCKKKVYRTKMIKNRSTLNPDASVFLLDDTMNSLLNNKSPI